MSAEKTRIPFGALAFGAGVLALGVLAARRELPEWRPVPPLSIDLAPKAVEAVRAAGGTLRLPKARLVTPADYAKGYERSFRRLGPAATAYLERMGGAVARAVQGTMELPEVGIGTTEILFDASGSIRGIDWTPAGPIAGFTEVSEKGRAARDAFLARIGDLLRGERARAGPELSYLGATAPVRVQPLASRAGEVPESILRVDLPNGAFLVRLTVRDPDAMRLRADTHGVREILVGGAPQAILLLLVLVLFALLLFRRRVSARIGLILGALAFVSMLVGGLGPESEAGGALVYSFTIAWRVALLLYLVILFIVAESLLRETVPGFTTSLDALAAGRLGPRAGRALLAGLGFGAAVAGERLLASSLAARLSASGFRPDSATFTLPLFAGRTTPFYEGPFYAAIFVLFVALLRFGLARRFAEPLAALVFALLLSFSVPLEPWGGAFASALAAAIVLYVAFHEFGFASLLTATTTAALLRETLAALHLRPVYPLAVLFGGAALALIAAAGSIGVRRPAREDEGKVEAPEYVRRLESERRVKYEMDLLSRMQLALLPDAPPEVPGVEIAVRTVLATEAGGDLYDFAVDGDGALWIAAGDVSGHGYSCGIQQAMVKAALASLVKAGRRPAEILCEVDRVLRTGKTRLFTTLLLLRLDPKTGAGVFSNAGHPYPLVLEAGACREIEAPALPLAQGPPRVYEDFPLSLAPGAILVLASDGLYEGPDRFDEPYGYERPRAILSAVGLFRRPAAAILEALFADWRRHVGEGAPADDTTVLVVKRPALFS
ncbi:MAG TPA: PP2C family protein-serine/threonine phosphatase [Thermoanaerobaculia bacterium]|nr:PP2C family protein-serine/threonine phosphatase [Thermoanaerobaculia bacterium]